MWTSATALKPPICVDHPEEARLRSIVAYGQWLIIRDSKCRPLKSLQGKIWQQGFASGELHGEVFPDVPIAFERWRRQKQIDLHLFLREASSRSKTCFAPRPGAI